MLEAPAIRLRSYQKRRRQLTSASPSSGIGACSTWLATGGGKTIIFAFITTHAAAKGNRVIILAHRQEIVDQISVALTAMGVPHGRIQPGYAATGDLVQVGMVQTVARRLDAQPSQPRRCW